jgi:hypothetical protein
MMDIEQIKNLCESKIGQQVKIKIKCEHRYRHGIIDKIDTFVFYNCFDSGEHESVFLKQKSKTLVIALKTLEAIM